mmetsp:Transcript_42320/g.68034  ORF Transcript_42320/g.68034 Transcript_42320/m.68034 type:complete len:521 (-) Transcript_42320:79-1641(-)
MLTKQHTSQSNLELANGDESGPPRLKRVQTRGSTVSDSHASNNSIKSKRSLSSHSPHLVLRSDTQLLPTEDLHYAAVSSHDKRKILNSSKIQSLGRKASKPEPYALQLSADNATTTVLSVLHSNESTAESPSADDTEQQCLKQNGFVRGKKIADTVQGEIFEATPLDEDDNTVVIKKTDKALHIQRISIQQGMSIVVEKDCVKEAILLHHLTVDNKATSDYVVKFVQFFESDTAYYLVMEKAGEMNLDEFSKRAHHYMLQKRLKLKDWKKFVKYIFWQIAVIVYWLHEDMKCCHLDLSLKNIVVSKGEFKEKADGSVSIDSNIQIKLVDFGLCECFETSKHVNALSGSLDTAEQDLQHDDDDDDEYKGNEFKCTKHGITDKVYLNAPNVFDEEAYDARASDCWDLGIILYQLATGLDPYSCADEANADYQRVKKHNLKQLLNVHQRAKYVTQKQLSLMQCLLNCRESARYSAVDVLKHDWLNLYFSKYKVLIKKKSDAQIARNAKFQSKMQKFPYYKCPN